MVRATGSRAAGSPDAQHGPVVVTEIMYDPVLTADEVAAGFKENDLEFIELENTTPVPVSLAGISVSDGVSFTFGDMTLDTGQFVVIVNNAQAFALHYGSGPLVAGQYQGSLKNKGEHILLADCHGGNDPGFQLRQCLVRCHRGWRVLPVHRGSRGRCRGWEPANRLETQHPSRRISGLRRRRRRSTSEEPHRHRVKRSRVGQSGPTSNAISRRVSPRSRITTASQTQASAHRIAVSSGATWQRLPVGRRWTFAFCGTSRLAPRMASTSVADRDRNPVGRRWTFAICDTSGLASRMASTSFAATVRSGPPYGYDGFGFGYAVNVEW